MPPFKNRLMARTIRRFSCIVDARGKESKAEPCLALFGVEVIFLVTKVQILINYQLFYGMLLPWVSN